jgi:hypothetical protein
MLGVPVCDRRVSGERKREEEEERGRERKREEERGRGRERKRKREEERGREIGMIKEMKGKINKIELNKNEIYKLKTKIKMNKI